MHISVCLPNEEAFNELLIDSLELLIGFGQLFDALIRLVNVTYPSRFFHRGLQCGFAVLHRHIDGGQFH